MHVLLIEDDEGIITSLSLYLKQSGFTVSVCSDGATATACFRDAKPHIVILDINLPGKNGVEICREIREESTTPIIILSARESEEDKVTLLELGADDYVSKPFSPRELVARMSAVTKRSGESGKSLKVSKTPKTLQLGRLVIDPKNYTARVDDIDLPLTKTEFSILQCLIQNAQSLVKRETLMKDIIGYENYVYDRTIDTHIKNLRRKTEGIIDIETVR